MAFNYFSQASHFNFKNRRKTSKWLKDIIILNKKVPGELSFIFCTDQQLLEINSTYLKHFYFTDVITFEYNSGEFISGDIFISIDMITENARIFDVTFDHELYRVMVHGVLHLLGYKDKTKKEQSVMRELENTYLKELNF